VSIKLVKNHDPSGPNVLPVSFDSERESRPCPVCDFDFEATEDQVIIIVGPATRKGFLCAANGFTYDAIGQIFHRKCYTIVGDEKARTLAQMEYVVYCMDWLRSDLRDCKTEDDRVRDITNGVMAIQAMAAVCAASFGSKPSARRRRLVARALAPHGRVRR